VSFKLVPNYEYKGIGYGQAFLRRNKGNSALFHIPPWLFDGSE